MNDWLIIKKDSDQVGSPFSTYIDLHIARPLVHLHFVSQVPTMGGQKTPMLDRYR